jgi:hypothetical protein
MCLLSYLFEFPDILLHLFIGRIQGRYKVIPIAHGITIIFEIVFSTLFLDAFVPARSGKLGDSASAK